jgi:hypothetical protein
MKRGDDNKNDNGGASEFSSLFYKIYNSYMLDFITSISPPIKYLILILVDPVDKKE